MSREPAIPLPARRRLVKDYARTRFGLEVDKQMRQSLIRRVRKGDVKYARKLTNSRTVIVLDHEGRRDGISLQQCQQGNYQLPISRGSGDRRLAALPIRGRETRSSRPRTAGIGSGR